MPGKLVCHEPLEFVNGKQRCLRCARVLSPALDTALDPSFVFCEGVTGSSAQSIARPATLRPNERWYDLQPWVDELAHVAGSARLGEEQRCSRCGEPVRLFTCESLAPGTTYVLRYEHPGDGEVKKSGRLIPVPSMESGVPMCAPTS
jgi:hypothetical protein